MQQSPSPLGNNRQARRLLLIGFGGLLFLLAFAGLYGISTVRAIQDRNERIRVDYVSRERILQQLRSDIYLSGTYVRDLLLERNPALADLHRKELDRARARINANTSGYARILLSGERAPFHQFMDELDRYFHSLEPVLRWTPVERERLGYVFINQSLLPKRMEIVGLTDKLGELNQKQLEAGNKNVKELFTSFQRSQVIVMLLSCSCGALLAGFSIQRLLQLESLSSRRFQEVVQTRGVLRDLSARLLDVQESERRAIARELHDEVGQSVSGLLLGIGNVAAILSPAHNAAALVQLQELKRLAEKTVAVVRDMSLLLRPSMLDDLGLLPALQWQAREIARTRNLAVQVFAGKISEDSLSEDQKTCVYRIVQEALQNVVRHADAKSVYIRFTQEPAGFALVVEDDGRGFEPSREKGLGLLGMEERVHHLNGTFRLTSHHGRGTTISVTLPASNALQSRVS